MKSYTDKEQSKKLSEILPLETADLCYIANSELLNIYEPFYRKVGKEDTPCWSLAALIGLTPNDVSLLHLEDRFQAVYDVKPYHITNKFDNPLDAAFEMICWLKENNKI